MIRLIQSGGAHEGREATFDQDLVRVGRMPDSDLAFDPDVDLDASGRHAEIRKEVGRYLLIDTGSRNGTWLNGERVKHALLKEGDEIQFGQGGPTVVVVEMEVSGQTSSAIGRLASQRISIEPAKSSQSDPVGGGVETAPPLELSSPVTPTVKPNKRNWLPIIAALLLGTVAIIALLAGRRDKPPAPIDLATVDAAAKKAVVSVLQPGATKPACIAFAVVRRTLLATTASCVNTIKVEGVQSERTRLVSAADQPLTVVKLWKHPNHKPGQVSPDIGLIEIDKPLAGALPLASLQSAFGLAADDQVYAWAPGLIESGVAEVASLPNFDADPEALSRIVYDAVAPVGSPVFDREGKVIAVHASDEPLEAKAVGGYGVRVDVLHGLLAGMPNN